MSQGVAKPNMCLKIETTKIIDQQNLLQKYLVGLRIEQADFVFEKTTAPLKNHKTEKHHFDWTILFCRGMPSPFRGLVGSVQEDAHSMKLWQLFPAKFGF